MPLQATNSSARANNQHEKAALCTECIFSSATRAPPSKARRALVDEPVLVDALARRQIRGAALDVVVEEPLPAGTAPRPKRPASGACGLPGAAPVGVAALLASGAARGMSASLR